MLVSVIIITKNQKELLQKSLPVLLKQDLDGEYEIIIVDSGSTDGAVEYVKSLPIKLVGIRPETFNFANAFNTGAKMAKGKYLIRLSGDVIPIKTDFLTELLKLFKDEKVGGTYGKYTITNRPDYNYPDFWPDERFPEKLTRYSIKPNPFKMIFSPKHMDQVTNFAGACCATRKEIWKKRPFNENLIQSEDAEYSWFLHTIGYDIVCNPKAEVIHEHKKIGRNFNLLSKWQLLLVATYAKYYLNKIRGIDDFRKLKLEFSLQSE